MKEGEISWKESEAEEEDMHEKKGRHEVKGGVVV